MPVKRPWARNTKKTDLIKSLVLKGLIEGMNRKQMVHLYKVSPAFISRIAKENNVGKYSQYQYKFFFMYRRK